ncbi:MAG: TSUP family transporter [Rubrivivax sp.]|nr:TSUP family transporter [Rubrivivax sp.]
MTLLAAFVVLLGGAAIGATSIGGVVVVPALVGLGRVPAENAVAAASFAFAFAGAAAFFVRRPQGATAAPHVPLVAFGWLAVLGAAAGAALGAATLAWLPARGVAWVVALLAIGSGLHALLGRGHARQRHLGAGVLALLALLVGALSAWSGTGGPVVLLPLLALLGWPANDAVDAAQRVQLPVAAAATVVNLAAGRLDLLLGAMLGALVLAGWALGRQLARRLPVPRLRQAVALALVATGVVFLFR